MKKKMVFLGVAGVVAIGLGLLTGMNQGVLPGAVVAVFAFVASLLALGPLFFPELWERKR